MLGINAKTGKSLSGLEHLKQSIEDILSTPLGSRVMRREYGSKLYQLIDAPLNQQTLLDITSGTAEALHRWEKRFRLEKVHVLNAESGKILLELSGKYKPDGKDITLEGIVI